jgi:hypothetical protein
MTDINVLLQQAGIEQKTCYTPADICQIFNISQSTFARLCDQWEPPNIAGRQVGLECYRIGTHRRVPHHSLIDFIKRSHNYEVTNR